MVMLDQPLFALVKRIQWKWPEGYDEHKVVVMFGGLHIEMTVLKTLGDWLDGSGWVQALVQAEITTPIMASCVQPMLPARGELTKLLRLHSISCSTMPMARSYRGR